VFQIGDLILYGRTGVCEVSDIICQDADDDREYYVLKPLYQNCGITTPVDNEKVFMRPIITKSEVDEIISTIPTVPVKAYHNRNLTQLKEHYKSCLESHECTDLVEMTMSLYTKRKEAEAAKKKFGTVDERFMKEAEDLLFGEFAAALGIDRQEVSGYISERIMDTASSM